MKRMFYTVLILLLTSCKTQVIEVFDFGFDGYKHSISYCAREFSFRNDRNPEVVKEIQNIADSTRSKDLAFCITVNEDTTFIRVLGGSVLEFAKHIPQEDVGVIFYPTHDKTDVKRLFFTQDIEDNLLFVRKEKKRYCFKSVIVKIPSYIGVACSDTKTSYKAYVIGDSIHVTEKVLD